MSNDIRAGGAYVELMLKDQKFRRGLDGARRGLSSFARGAIALAGPLAAGFSFAAAIKSASDLEEVMNKFNVVFGKNAGSVKAWGDQFASEVGRSQKQVAEFLANSQDLFIPLGFEPGAAEALSKQVTGLAFDLASFNNMQDADTMRDLHAALTGSGEVMKKYGVVLSETAVKQELLNQGLDPKTATQQQKAQARMNIILAGTTAAQGDAIRSAGGFANQLKALQGRLSDMAAEFGSIVLPIVTRFVTAMSNAVGVVIGMRDQMAPVFAAIAQTVWDVFVGIGQIVSSVWNQVGESTSSIMGWMQEVIIGSLQTISFAFANWKKLLSMAVVSAQLAVVRFANQTIYFFTQMIPGYLKWFADNWRDIFMDVASMTATIATNIWNNLRNLWDAIVGLFSGEGFSFEWTPLTQGFESAIKELPQIAEREMGPLEQKLQDELDGLATDLVDQWQVHGQEFSKRTADMVKPPAIAAAGGDAAAAGQGDETPALPDMSAAKKEVFATFSAAAALAQGGGQGKDVVGTLREQHREAQRVRQRTLRALEENGGALT